MQTASPFMFGSASADLRNAAAADVVNPHWVRWIADHVQEMERELHKIRTGEVVVMPVSIEHASAMHLVAQRYIEDNRK